MLVIYQGDDIALIVTSELNTSPNSGAGSHLMKVFSAHRPVVIGASGAWANINDFQIKDLELAATILKLKNSWSFRDVASPGAEPDQPISPDTPHVYTACGVSAQAVGVPY